MDPNQGYRLPNMHDHGIKAVKSIRGIRLQEESSRVRPKRRATGLSKREKSGVCCDCFDPEASLIFISLGTDT